MCNEDLFQEEYRQAVICFTWSHCPPPFSRSPSLPHPLSLSPQPICALWRCAKAGSSFGFIIIFNTPTQIHTFYKRCVLLSRCTPKGCPAPGGREISVSCYLTPLARLWWFDGSRCGRITHPGSLISELEQTRRLLPGDFPPETTLKCEELHFSCVCSGLTSRLTQATLPCAGWSVRSMRAVGPLGHRRLTDRFLFLSRLLHSSCSLHSLW